MVDRYVPTLEAFVVSEDEQSAITSALATADPWGWAPGGAQQATLVAWKSRIRTYHLQRHAVRCCYCRKNLHGEFSYVIDREHVLPKSVPGFRSLSYTMWNLGASCKRCNMQYKGSKIDFVVDPHNQEVLEDPANYRLIHPNFDLYSEHMERAAVEVNDTVVVKYSVVGGSAKGTFTHGYFNLNDLEVGSFDKAQGIEKISELGEGALEAARLAQQFGQ
jgi:hypothetical protein